MLERFKTLAASRVYWSLLLFGGLAVESVALYYQYGHELPPCVLCIHVRLWIAVLIIVAGIMLLAGRRVPALSGHVLMLAIGVGLAERSYQLLGNERGFIIGACGFDLGLPGWFAPDKWWPAMFEVQTTCGYTPELLLGITMAEALIVGSVLFSLWTALLIVAIFRR